MRLALATLIIGAALVLPATAAAGGDVPVRAEPLKTAQAPRVCTDPFRLRPARPAAKAELKRLDELPPADLTLAVLDRIDGCIEPRTIRQGIGAFGR